MTEILQSKEQLVTQIKALQVSGFTLLERALKAEKEIGRLRNALRVNGLRWGYSDEDIDKILYPAE